MFSRGNTEVPIEAGEVTPFREYASLGSGDWHICVNTVLLLWNEFLLLWRTLSVYKWNVIDCQVIRNQEDRYWPLTSGILLGFYINLLLNYRANFTTETCKQILNYTFMPSRLFSFVCYQLADEALHIGLASVQIQSYVIYIHVTFHV